MPKKIPMRMCVACRSMRPKKELVRIVRTTEGELKIDPTGRANGRGAYLCRDVGCLEKAIKTKALDRALDAKIEAGVLEELKKGFEVGNG